MAAVKLVFCLMTRLSLIVEWVSWTGSGYKGVELVSVSLTLVESTCFMNSQEVLQWTLINGIYYSVYNQTVNVTTARGLCQGQPGNVRLAVLSKTSDYNAVRAYLENFAVEPKQFWLDATRMTGEEHFTWADGCVLPLSASSWGPGEPALGADSLGIASSSSDPLASYRSQFELTALLQPLCQSASALAAPPLSADITWKYLGNSSQIFGFSTKMAGYYEARNVCAAIESDVRLAVLDMYFCEVTQYVAAVRTEDEFWVDATRLNKTADFYWANGVRVQDSFWAPLEPLDATFARLRRKPGTSEVQLTGKNKPEHVMYYVCQMEIADWTTAEEKQFDSGCPENVTISTTTEITLSSVVVMRTMASAATPTISSNLLMAVNSTTPDSSTQSDRTSASETDSWARLSAASTAALSDNDDQATLRTISQYGVMLETDTTWIMSSLTTSEQTSFHPGQLVTSDLISPENKIFTSSTKLASDALVPSFFLSTMTTSQLASSLPAMTMATMTMSQLTTSLPAIAMATMTTSQLTTSLPALTMASMTTSQLTTSLPSISMISTKSQLTTSLPAMTMTTTMSQLTTSLPVKTMATMTTSQITTSLPSMSMTTTKSQLTTSLPAMTMTITTSQLTTSVQVMTMVIMSMSQTTTSLPAMTMRTTMSQLMTSLPAMTMTTTMSQLMTSLPAMTMTTTTSKLTTSVQIMTMATTTTSQLMTSLHSIVMPTSTTSQLTASLEAIVMPTSTTSPLTTSLETMTTPTSIPSQLTLSLQAMATMTTSQLTTSLQTMSMATTTASQLTTSLQTMTISSYTTETATSVTSMSQSSPMFQATSTLVPTAAVVQTTASKTAVVKPKLRGDCRCSCVKRIHLGNQTQQIGELQEKITLIQKSLELKKRDLSAWRRRKTSAEDSRLSAIAMGSAGLLLFSVTVIVIFISDFPKLRKLTIKG